MTSKPTTTEPSLYPSIQELTNDGPIRTVGVLVLLITVVGFGLWAFLAPIDGAAMAPGYVIVKSHKKTVQHLEGGIVSQLLVKDGDVVKEGDMLLVLDGTEDKALLEVARGQFIALAAEVARLEAERDGKQAINFPESLNDLDDVRVNEAKRGEQQVFSARKQAHEGEMSVLKQRVGQLQSKIEGLRGQRNSKQQLVTSFGEEAVDLRELLNEGFADKQRLREIERSHALNTGEVSALASDIAASEIQIGETKLQILQLEKKFQEEVASKLSEAQSKLYDVSQRMLASRDKVNRIEIKAPTDGRVMGMSMYTVGGVVMAGRPILEIVPQQEELVVDAQVSPLDIDRVQVGLLAEVRFSAFKQAVTPYLEGKVINLSADRMVEEKTGTPYYQAQVELTEASLKKMQHLQLVPGMPVEVLIKTGERTVFQYLTKPISNAFARAFIED
jgi:epimerase transport system membrane fusion protein